MVPVSARNIAVLLLAGMLAAPAVAAFTPTPTSRGTAGEGTQETDMPNLASFQAILAPWLAPASGYGVLPYASESVTKDTTLYISSLGDADGDGHNDLVYSRRDKEGLGTMEARSGAALSTVLWSLPLGESYGYVADDVDGDGVRDLAYEEVGDSKPVGASAAVVFVGAGADTPITTHFVSGKTGKDLFSVAGAFGYSLTGVFALFGAAEQYSFSYSWATVAGAKTVAQVAMTQDWMFADACPLVTCAFASRSDMDVTVSFLDEKGASRGKVERLSDTIDVVSVNVADLTGDGVPEAFTTEMEGFNGNVDGNAVPVSRTSIHAFATDGTELWSIVEDPALNFYNFALAVGDMDADGKQDVGYLEVTMKDPSNFHSRLSLLSGANGATIGVLEEDNAASFLIPFGKGPNGKTEALLLQGAFTGDGGLSVSAVGSDLKPRWTQSIDEAEPMNFATSSFEFTGFTDWTGDGASDLALIQASEDYPAYTFAVELVDGATGKPAWQAEHKDALDISILPDLTGKGQNDYAVSSQEGAFRADFSQSTVSFTAYAAEDGGALFRQVMRQPEGPAGQSGGLNMTVKGVGDVTGDALPDLAVWIEEATPGPEEHDVGSFTFTTPGRGTVTWYLLASDGGVDVAPDTGGPGEPTDGAPGDDDAKLPPAEDLSNGRPQPSAARPEGEEGEQKTPGLALPMVLALVGLLAWAARRRTR